jgi:hypothetical protein
MMFVLFNNNTTIGISGAGTAYPYKAPELVNSQIQIFTYYNI